MFVLFGWGKVTSKDYGPTLPQKCNNCNNEVYLNLFHVREWFTLFFIPVIPYSSKYMIMCNVCSRGYELKGESIKEIKAINELTTRYLAKEISESDYLSSMNSHKLIESS